MGAGSIRRTEKNTFSFACNSKGAIYKCSGSNGIIILKYMLGKLL
jgi:hypothetical protein